MENSEATAEIEVTPGQRLRDARESAGMSPREMADRLNWLPSHVAAIENDRYEELKGAAFVRGYLRAYARAVTLDEDEIVGLYTALHPEQETATQSSAITPSTVPSQATGMSVVLGVAVAAIVIAAIWWKQQGADSGSAVPVSAGAQQPAAVAETPVDSPQLASTESPDTDSEASSPLPSTADEDSSMAAAIDADVAAATPTPVEAPEPAPPAASAEPVAPSAPAVASALAPDGALQFSFSGDCWLEVRDGEGQLIYADLRRAGDTLGLDGVPPFEILAGDAAAVSLSYLGEPVAMQTRPGRDTARFKVGEP